MEQKKILSSFTIRCQFTQNCIQPDFSKSMKPQNNGSVARVKLYSFSAKTRDNKRLLSNTITSYVRNAVMKFGFDRRGKKIMSLDAFTDC